MGWWGGGGVGETLYYIFVSPGKVYNYELTDVRNFANLTVISQMEFKTIMIYVTNRKLVTDNMCVCMCACVCK